MKKNILITWTARWLWHALTKEYLHNWDTVIAIVRNVKSSKKLESEFKNNCHIIVADISKDSSINIISGFLKKHNLTIDVLINNAGIWWIGTEICNIDTKGIMDLFNVHCLWTIRVTQATLSSIKKSKNPKIINISSRLASLSNMAKWIFAWFPTSYAYRIAKGSQNMFTACLYQELIKEKIIVATVHPWRIKTWLAIPGANLKPETAANNIINYIESVSLENSWSFYDTDNKCLLPW